MKINKRDIIGEFNIDVKGPISDEGLLRYVENKHNDVFFDFDVYLPSKGINLQRDLVWTQIQKQELIKSILKKQSIPPFYMVRNKISNGPYGHSNVITYKVIDGKQRLTTLFSYIKGEFPIILENGENVFIHDLDDETRTLLERFHIDMFVYFEYPDNKLTDDELIMWFERINFAGTAQDIEHLNNLKIKR
jgi:hypothetical protein